MSHGASPSSSASPLLDPRRDRIGVGAARRLGRGAESRQVRREDAPAGADQRRDVAHPMRPAAGAAVQQQQRRPVTPGVPDGRAVAAAGLEALRRGFERAQVVDRVDASSGSMARVCPPRSGAVFYSSGCETRRRGHAMMIGIWMVALIGIGIWSLVSWGVHALLSLEPDRLAELKPLIAQIPFADELDRWLPGWQALLQFALDLTQGLLAGRQQRCAVAGVGGLGGRQRHDCVDRRRGHPGARAVPQGRGGEPSAAASRPAATRSAETMPGAARAASTRARCLGKHRVQPVQPRLSRAVVGEAGLQAVACQLIGLACAETAAARRRSRRSSGSHSRRNRPDRRN